MVSWTSLSLHPSIYLSIHLKTYLVNLKSSPKKKKFVNYVRWCMLTKLILVIILQYMYVNYISVKLKSDFWLIFKRWATQQVWSSIPWYLWLAHFQTGILSPADHSLCNFFLFDKPMFCSFCTLTSGHQHLCSQWENESYTEKGFLSQEKGKDISLL